MKEAVIYCRVSTAEQANEGESLAAQEHRGRAWAEANGYAVAAVYADRGVSGKRADNRPELQRALENVCKAQGVLVVYSLSRLARSIADAIEISERLNRSGANFVSLSESLDTTTASGRFTFHVLSALSQLERELTGERTASVLQFKKSQGERYGELPWGFALADDGVSLVEDAEELNTLRYIADLREEGDSFRAIAERLNSEGYRTKKGRSWAWHTVRMAHASLENVGKIATA